jgi:transposase
MSKNNRQIRQYDEEFKRRAVQLYRSNSKSYITLSEELGIPVSTLVGWVQNCRYANPETSSAPENSDVIKEFKLLKKELAIIKEERDILKKALAIFSVDVPKS